MEGEAVTAVQGQAINDERLNARHSWNSLYRQQEVKRSIQTIDVINSVLSKLDYEDGEGLY